LTAVWSALPKGLALFAAFVFVGVQLLFHGNSLFEGHDGALYLSTIQNIRIWGLAGALTTVAPLSAMGTGLLPINVWIDPALCIGALLPDLSEAQLVTIYLVHALLFFSSCFVLVAVLGAGWGVATAVAYVVTLAMLPPCNAMLGVYPLANLNSNILLVASSFLLATSGLFVVSRRPATAISLCLGGLMCGVGLLYGILIEPLWGAIYLLFFLATFTAIAGVCLIYSHFTCWSPLVVLLLVVVGLWATGILEHVHLCITYTARMVFPTEIYGAIQDFPNSAMPFRDIRSSWLFSFLLLGQISGVLWGSQLVRIACFVCIAALIAMTCMVIIYVFVVPNWPYPMPAYFEFAGTPLFLIAAISGYIEFLRRIFSKFAAQQLGWFPHLPALGWWIALVAFTTLTLCTFMFGQASLLHARTTRAQVFSRFLTSNPIIDVLESETAMKPGSLFRGSVATLIGVSERGLAEAVGRDPKMPYDIYISSQMYNSIFLGSGNEHRRMSYWFRGIPTLEEYGQLITPQFYFLCSRLLSRSVDYQSRNVIDITKYRMHLLEMLGTRFVVTDTLLPGPATLKETIALKWSTKQLALNLYELPNPNLGNFSPTEIVRIKSPDEAVELMARPETNFRKTAFVLEPFPEQLVQAKWGSLRWQKGGIQVRAESSATSLLVLPVQYSKSWCVEPKDKIRLIRVNLGQLGVVFSRHLDARIKFRSGLLSRVGKSMDVAQAKTIFREPEPVVSVPEFVYPRTLWRPHEKLPAK